MKKGENLFIVDLGSVSFFSPHTLNNIVQRPELYKDTPFLYLIFSYIKNETIAWAGENLEYLDFKTAYAWNIWKYKYN